MTSARLDRRRLALVLDRFQSTHDGERLAAIEAAGRLLASAGTTWRDILETGSDDGDGRRDTLPDDHRVACAELLRQADWVCRHTLCWPANQWERDFLTSLTAKDGPPSPKQVEILGRIRAKIETAHSRWQRAHAAHQQAGARA